MLKLANLTEVNAALQPFIPLSAKITGRDITLARSLRLLEYLGNPQDKIRIVHIAGTSGKTSTAYFTAGLLRAADLHVGLTVSPHVDSVTERVQLDGAPLSDEKFCDYLGEFLDLVANAPEQPTYFELLTAFAYWVFAREGVDYAVVETGLGGLQDSTNVAARADKLCIITDIGYDHMHVLGHTIAEIAAQKIGIVHQQNPVIMYHQSTEVSGVVEAWVQKHDAELHATTQADEAATYGQDFDDVTPVYQQRNWLLAYAAYRFLQQRDGLPELTAEQLRGTQQLQVPGRMDIRTVNGKTIVMDGAHNGQKMATFLQSFQHRFPGVKPAVLIALKQGKEPADVAPLLARIASRIIVTTFDTSQDLPAKSIDADELADIFQSAGAQAVVAMHNHHEAYEAVLAGSEDVCMITGSFYLLSQVRDEEKLTQT